VLLILRCVSKLATGGTCVRLDALYLAYQISIVPKTVASDPNPRNDVNRMVGAFLCGAFFLVLDPPCKVNNRSIIGLSLLSETA
jgi:hypothetical protein